MALASDDPPRKVIPYDRQQLLADLPLAVELVATDFDGWPDRLKTEFTEHAQDGDVGSRLLSENDLHDIENIGDTELVFTTVEHLDSANAPLPLA